MKVYVVQAGEYSGRHIVGVAITEEAANDIVKANDARDYDKADIEIFDTDDYLPFKDMTLFHVYQYKSGSIIAYPSEPWWIKEEPLNRVKGYKKGNARYSVLLFAKDEAHALKIAQDLFAEYKARKEGVAI